MFRQSFPRENEPLSILHFMALTLLGLPGSGPSDSALAAAVANDHNSPGPPFLCIEGCDMAIRR